MKKHTLDSIPFVLLAGGASQRMGFPKGLFEFGNQPWLDSQIESFRKISQAPMVVVLGHHSQEYEAKSKQLKSVTPVLNPHPERGQFSSIVEGLKAFKTGAAFLCPIDVPIPDAETLQSLCKELVDEQIDAVIPQFDGLPGHPILISEDFCNELRQLGELDARLDIILQMKQTRRVEVEDGRICLNINQPNEYGFNLQPVL